VVGRRRVGSDNARLWVPALRDHAAHAPSGRDDSAASVSRLHTGKQASANFCPVTIGFSRQRNAAVLGYLYGRKCRWLRAECSGRLFCWQNVVIPAPRTMCAETRRGSRQACNWKRDFGAILRIVFSCPHDVCRGSRPIVRSPARGLSSKWSDARRVGSARDKAP
jgi:hypothetical protein